MYAVMSAERSPLVALSSSCSGSCLACPFSKHHIRSKFLLYRSLRLPVLRLFTPFILPDLLITLDFLCVPQGTSCLHDIDNASSLPLTTHAMNPTQWEPDRPFPHSISSSPTLSPPTSPDPLVTQVQSSHPQQKGKGPSIPVEIPSSGRVHDAQTDLFSISLDSASFSGSSHPALSLPPTIQPELTSTLLELSCSHNDLDADTDVPHLGKGKARDKDGDIPPTLPPLTFPPMTFDICPSPSLIPGSGPSSYGSLCHPRLAHEGYYCTPDVMGTSTPLDVAIVLPHASPRRRSFSNPPSIYPGYPIATSSAQTRVEIGPSRGPDVLSHKFSLSSPDRSQT